MRVTGERGMGWHVQRPDPIEKYGYDTKVRDALHTAVLRMSRIAENRHLTLSRPQPERQHLIDIRSGKYKQDRVFAVGQGTAAECESLLAVCTLPEEVDRLHLSRLIADAYRSHWNI
jgi:uncharacterized protein